MIWGQLLNLSEDQFKRVIFKNGDNEATLESCNEMKRKCSVAHGSR